ncbi:MAG: hypothetical protein WBA93_11970 [Microcoleaceae cyanobacterium]
MKTREDLTPPALLMTQGKLLSQMVAYIWRWAYDDDDKEKTQEEQEKNKYAMALKYCFERKHNPQIRLPGLLKQDQFPETPYLLEKLLTVDAKSYLDDTTKKPENECAKLAELLINVFGKDRVAQESFLSPIFEPESIEMPGNDTKLPVYQIHIDQNTFTGTLKDPNMEERIAYKFLISYPPCPKFSNSTVTKEDLDQWLANTDEETFRSQSPYIPVSSS